MATARACNRGVRLDSTDGDLEDMPAWAIVVEESGRAPDVGQFEDEIMGFIMTLGVDMYSRREGVDWSGPRGPQKRPAPCGDGLGTRLGASDYSFAAGTATLTFLTLRGFTMAGLAATGVGCGADPEMIGAAGA